MHKVRTGYGTFVQADLEYKFKNGKANGRGTLTCSIYVGEWKNGNKPGSGTLTYKDGSKYVGEFKLN